MLNKENLEKQITFCKATIERIEQELKTNVVLRESLEVNKFVLKAFEDAL